jgi:hypothetical protein
VGQHRRVVDPRVPRARRGPDHRAAGHAGASRLRLRLRHAGRHRPQGPAGRRRAARDRGEERRPVDGERVGRGRRRRAVPLPRAGALGDGRRDPAGRRGQGRKPGRRHRRRGAAQVRGALRRRALRDDGRGGAQVRASITSGPGSRPHASPMQEAEYIKRRYDRRPEPRRWRSPPAARSSSVGFDTLQGFVALQRIGQAFASSSLVPEAYQGNVANCMIAIEMAARMRASPLMVMQNLYLIHGRPSWSSQYLIASFNDCGRFSAIKYRWTGEKGSRRGAASPGRARRRRASSSKAPRSRWRWRSRRAGSTRRARSG